jgi:hypothetical protein
MIAATSYAVIDMKTPRAVRSSSLPSQKRNILHLQAIRMELMHLRALSPLKQQFEGAEFINDRRSQSVIHMTGPEVKQIT